MAGSAGPLPGWTQGWAAPRQAASAPPRILTPAPTAPGQGLPGAGASPEGRLWPGGPEHRPAPQRRSQTCQLGPLPSVGARLRTRDPCAQPGLRGIGAPIPHTRSRAQKGRLMPRGPGPASAVPVALPSLGRGSVCLVPRSPRVHWAPAPAVPLAPTASPRCPCLSLPRSLQSSVLFHLPGLPALSQPASSQGQGWQGTAVLGRPHPDPGG